MAAANILLGNGDLMVSLDQIDLKKNSAARHAVIEGLHVGQGVPVGNNNRVEVAVGAAGTPGAILLGHQVQGGRPR